MLEARHEAELGEDASEETVGAVNKKTLDLYLHYLRTVFSTCYYCLASFDFSEELSRRCAKHVRRAVETGPKKLPSDGTWTSNLDKKLPLLLDRELIDPCEFGGESYDEELHRACRSCIKHEEEGKFRCKECNKLFSALKFIEKHLSTKHPEALGDSLDDLEFFNNYVLDPSHLSPFSVDDTPRPQQSASRHSDRSLSDRLGDRLPDDGGRNGRRKPQGRAGGRNAPPPPQGAVMDPRARKGASSYADLDTAPEGTADSVMLPY